MVILGDTWRSVEYARIFEYSHTQLSHLSLLIYVFSLSFCMQQWEKRKFLFIDVCEKWLDVIIFLIIFLTSTEIIHVKDLMWTFITDAYINKRLFLSFLPPFIHHSFDSITWEREIVLNKLIWILIKSVVTVSHCIIE